mmetsp:Transcript_50077/g.128897  ORF Transcript_50077/g.128897 Transcript_50077/m.128897 type:complete len:128 (+) Transcript_50077:808-1191(+)
MCIPISSILPDVRVHPLLDEHLFICRDGSHNPHHDGNRFLLQQGEESKGSGTIMSVLHKAHERGSSLPSTQFIPNTAMHTNTCNYFTRLPSFGCADFMSLFVSHTYKSEGEYLALIEHQLRERTYVG